MVNVYTKNGNFNISESLMEAIKDNNPELLMEKKNNNKNNNKNEENSNAEKSFDETEELSKLLNKTWHQSIDDVLQSSKLKLSREDYVKLYNYIHNPKNEKYIKDILDVEKRNENLNIDTLTDEIFNRAEWYAQKVHDEHTKEYIKNLVRDENEIANKAIEYEKQEKQEKEQRDIERRLRQYHVNDAEDQILFQQILKNGGNISKGIKIDGKKLTRNQIEKRIKRNPYFEKAWKEFENNNEEKEEIAKNAEEINRAKEETSIKNQDYAPDTLEDLLNSKGLIDEINMTESAAKKLVETSKECISDILGLIGNTQRNNSSNLVKNTFNNNKTNNVNDNIQKQQNLKKAVGEAVNTSTSAISNTNYDTSNVANDNKKSQTNDLLYKPKATGGSRYAKGIGALLTGGFNIKPLFNGDPSDKQRFGMSMKYYKEYTKSKNNNSLIDNLMDYLIEKHSNKSDFEKHIGEQLVSKYGKKLTKSKLQNKIQTLSDDLDRISANFLGNVVYRLEVGNDNTFNEIMRAIRFAPKIKEKYYVSNESKLQMFGVREQALIFKNINSESVVSIFVATPLLARATELGKQALKLTRHFKNIKA